MTKTTIFSVILPGILLTCLLFSCGENADHNTHSYTTPVKMENTSEKDGSLLSEKDSTAQHIDTTISLDYIMGKFDPANHPDFVKVSTEYADRPGMYLRRETYEAFKQMHHAASQAGVELQIKSATRNFDYQKEIWEGKWKGQRLIEGGKNAAKAYPDPVERALAILEWSSMPGSSRHHWGTDIDLNNFTNSYFKKGKGYLEYKWLVANAAKYGFCQPYSIKWNGRPDGYNEEKWHWSFLPLSRPLTQQAALRLKDEMISGFEGAEVAPQIQIVQKYVLGINKECL